MMKLVVNGESVEHEGDGKVVSFLAEMHADCDRVAIMVNEEVVRRSEWGSVNLKEGDRVEVLTYAGGG
jgi:sulfur carrier protein